MGDILIGSSLSSRANDELNFSCIASSLLAMVVKIVLVRGGS